MKKITLKALLMAAALGMGGNAWAQVSTWTAVSGTYTKGQQIKGSTEGVIVMTLGEDNAWTYDSGRKGVVTRSQQSPTISNGVPTAGGYVIITPIRTLNLKLNTYSSQSNCNVYMTDGTNTLKNFRQKGYNTNDYGTLEAGNTYYIYGGGFKTTGDLEYVFFCNFTATTYENYTIHYVDKNGTTIKNDVVHSGLYGSEVTASAEDMASVVYGGKSYGYKSGNKTITLGTGTNEITLVYETASVCNYTIKYVDGEGIAIADDVEIESYVGAEVTASGDKLPTYLWKDDVKYKYVSGNEVLTVTGTNDVITLVYAEAAKYNYSVQTSYGEVIYGQEGSAYENETVTYYWAAVMNNNGTLYTANAVNNAYKGSFVADSDNKVQTINYTATTTNNLVYLNEGENVFTKGTGSTADTRGSMGAGGYQNSPKGFVTLPAGKYILVISNRCSGTRTAVHNFTAGTGDAAVTVLAADGNGYNATRTSEEFTLTQSTTLYFEGGSDNQWVDYLYVYKTGDYTETKTISAAGYATYYSVNALDFTGTGLTAYVATEEGDDISFTEVTKVPANTGVLLKGAAGTYAIPVTADGGSATSAMVGVTEDTQIAAGIFVLLNGEQGIGFYETENPFTVGANTAYFPASIANGVKDRFIGVESDDATAITAIEAADAIQNGVIYNLSGQRVVKPLKGIYIQNGKKIIVK